MEKDKLKEAIAGLTGSTAAAKLRQVMPEIDRKVQDGVRHEEIVAALAEAGIEVKLETLRKNLYRYRAKNRAVGVTSPPSRPASVTNGNSSASEDSEDQTPAPVAENQFEDALDPKKRDAIGEKYLGKSRPLFGKTRSEKK
ncbi:hypothetical protein [Candidatus Burkholderia verschuerenii]|uniref:hypothetical protein n=1 Tax=Candidatus Burkholderia verschuerenii TaxID=242163 RepID=UPI00067DB6C2|nr:hypothetical protein [Candidatus Burkholderia verschuerenii]